MSREVYSTFLGLQLTDQNQSPRFTEFCVKSLIQVVLFTVLLIEHLYEAKLSLPVVDLVHTSLLL
jgi:hypothetical protein